MEAQERIDTGGRPGAQPPRGWRGCSEENADLQVLDKQEGNVIRTMASGVALVLGLLGLIHVWRSEPRER